MPFPIPNSSFPPEDYWDGTCEIYSLFQQTAIDYFLYSFQEGKELTLPASTQAVPRQSCNRSYRILTAKRHQGGCHIHSVDASEDEFYEEFSLRIGKRMAGTVPWGPPPGQTMFSLCKESRLMRIDTWCWSWLQIVHYKLRKGPLSSHLL